MPLLPATGLYSATTTLSTLSADISATLTSLFQGAEPTPKTIVASTYAHLATDGPLIFNVAGTCTVTLLSASANSGRVQLLRTIAAQTVVSAASNVVPLVGGAAGTAILAGTAGKWAILQSDGTSWQVMAGN